jgi:signal transduction histidine kinase
MRKLPSVSRSSRRWWFIVALVVGPAAMLAGLGVRALRMERIEREQELWRRQSQLLLLADRALSNTFSALERDLSRGGVELPEGSPTREDGRSARHTKLVFDPQQILVFPDDRVYFGEFGRRPTLAVPLPISSALATFTDEARAAEARRQPQTALDSYRRVRAAEPRLRPWANLNIARIQYRQPAAEIASQWNSGVWLREDAVSPTGIPVAVLACIGAAESAAPGPLPVQGLLLQTLENLRRGRWWLGYQERTSYDKELVRLLRTRTAGNPAPEERDRRLDELATVDQAVRLSPPHRRGAATRSYEETATGTFLLVWAPAASDPDTWNGAAIRAEDIGAWLEPVLTPLFDGLSFGAWLSDGGQRPLWAVRAGELRAQRRERLRSLQDWELAFTFPPVTAGTSARTTLWYGFILLPVLMLIVGIAAATRIVRREMELGRMQSDFIGAVSHEFKSPLTSIRLLVERIAGRRYPSPEAAEPYWRAIDNEAGRLEKLVNRLLDWQQIEARRKRYSLECGSLTDVVRAAVELLRPQAEAKAVSLEVSVAGNIPAVRFDRATMTDALENLVDNAIRYSHAGGKVSVTLSAGAGQVHVEVADEGIGIHPVDLPRVFDKFYRGSLGNQESVRGTGLGLALVKAAVEAHEGTVDVQSEVGRGSRFVITLPAGPGEENRCLGS